MSVPVWSSFGLVCLLAFLGVIAIGLGALAVMFRGWPDSKRLARRRHGPMPPAGGDDSFPAAPGSPVVLGVAQPAMIQPGTIQRAPAREGQFIYSNGDRPLDGYTIKRGIGRGGFGEVYYAMSDGGKEVALKLVQRHLDVELRGVTQCLNLKHPNLVTIYDVKQAANGDYWIVMEYLTGAGLSEVLAANANGLPHDQVLAWLRGIADGVGYLHEHGIVHRDLKPGNIFVENGAVKIGDYGLAKFISASRRSGQTESVGTVHYMAPEVAHGRYGKEIDLYALGVILYELLTGRVPFNGQSPGEIMMKHLTAQPDTNMLPEPFRVVVARLLAKDPSARYANVQEMLAALSGESLPAARIEAPARAIPATVAFRPPVSVSAQSRGFRHRESQGPSRSRSGWPLAVGLVAGLLFAILLIYLARGGPLPDLTSAANRSATEFTGRGPSADDVDLVLKTYLFIEAREKPLKEIAGRSGMTSEDQIYLIDAVVQKVPIVEQQVRILAVLAGNPDLTATARKHLISRLDNIPMLNEREQLTKLVLDNPGRPSPSASVAVVGTSPVAGSQRVWVVFAVIGFVPGCVILVNVLRRGAHLRLYRAARTGDISRVRLLLVDGADVNVRRWNNRTALIAAAEAGHIAVVQHLLERGADPNARMSDGETALSLATVAGHAAVVEMLLTAGADVNSRANDGDTPLIEAAYAGHVAILNKLLDHGADMTARSSSDGSTPLIWAAYEGHTACVEALVQHGANVNEKDTGDGSTPLIWAAYGGHPNVVRVLLDHGADPHETNSSGESAFDHAESDAIRALLEAAVARR